MPGSVCFGSRANLLDESSAAQRLDRSLKGRLQFPLTVIYFAAVAKAMGAINKVPSATSRSRAAIELRSGFERSGGRDRARQHLHATERRHPPVPQHHDLR